MITPVCERVRPLARAGQFALAEFPLNIINSSEKLINHSRQTNVLFYKPFLFLN